MNVRALSLCLVLVSGIACGGPSAPLSRSRPPRDCGLAAPPPPPGYAPPALEGIDVAAPRACDEGWFLKLARKAGTRRLGPIEGAGCSTLPANPGDPSQCPIVNYNALLGEVLRELRDEHVEINGTGSPCSSSEEGRRLWYVSLGVLGWKDADDALRKLATLVDRYDVIVDNELGISVVGLRCLHPL